MFIEFSLLCLNETKSISSAKLLGSDLVLGNSKALSLEALNFFSTYLRNSTSSFSILGFMYLYFLRGPQAKPMMFPFPNR